MNVHDRRVVDLADRAALAATDPGGIAVPDGLVLPPASPWRLQPGLALSPGCPQVVAVLDTNALANACCYEAATGFDSLVTRLVYTERVPCFIADHVPGEMHEHLERICRSRKVDPADAFHVWHTKVAPLLRVVELPVGEYLRPEIAGIRRPEPDGDPDDLPTLALAAFLGPTVLVTSDRVFYRLGYGNAEDWTASARILREAAELEGRQIDRMFMTVVSTRLVSAGVRGVVRLTRQVPWILPFVALGLGWLAGTMWSRRDGVRDGMADMWEAGQPSVQRMLAEFTELAELRTLLVTVSDPPWRTESLTERCARYLARSGQPMTPTELRDTLDVRSDQRITAAGLRRIISGHPSFRRAPGDRYHVGASIDG
jgi:predicted nucleic acid-binding protein